MILFLVDFETQYCISGKKGYNNRVPCRNKNGTVDGKFYGLD